MRGGDVGQREVMCVRVKVTGDEIDARPEILLSSSFLSGDFLVTMPMPRYQSPATLFG